MKKKIKGQKKLYKPNLSDIELYGMSEKKSHPIIPKSRNFEPRPAYEKRMWKSTKKMPRKFKDEEDL